MSVKKILNTKFFFVIGVIILVLLIASFAREFSRRYYLQQEIKSLQDQINGLDTQNQQFSQLINYFDTNNFTEAEARLKLGLKKPGEEVVVINQPDDSNTTITTADQEANLSAPAKWWQYFFKR